MNNEINASAQHDWLWEYVRNKKVWDDDRFNKPAMQGWVCPRCGKVHSPFVQACDCPPHTVVGATTKADWRDGR